MTEPKKYSQAAINLQRDIKELKEAMEVQDAIYRDYVMQRNGVTRYQAKAAQAESKKIYKKLTAKTNQYRKLRAKEDGITLL